MRHQLHSAAFIEESLRDNRLLRRYGTKHGLACQHILDNLLGTTLIQCTFLLEPAKYCALGAERISGRHPIIDIAPKAGHLSRQLCRARWGFAPPKGNVRWCAMSVLHP